MAPDVMDRNDTKSAPHQYDGPTAGAMNRAPTWHDTHVYSCVQHWVWRSVVPARGFAASPREFGDFPGRQGPREDHYLVYDPHRVRADP